MKTVMAVAITIVCLVVLLELQSLDAADEVKGPKVTEKVPCQTVLSYELRPHLVLSSYSELSHSEHLFCTVVIRP